MKDPVALLIRHAPPFVKERIPEPLKDRMRRAYFWTRSLPLRFLPRKETFEHIYEKNGWQNDESLSGTGSTLEATRSIRRALPQLVDTFEIDTLLDVPCGDFAWMRHVDLEVDRYLGADIVEELVAENRRRYGDRQREFLQLDLVRDELPCVDLILCRDCLVHLSFDEVGGALERIRESGSTYLLTTTFPAQPTNRDIATGRWRPLNLERPPFEFSEPIRLNDDDNPLARGPLQSTRLALWRIDDL